MTQKYNVPEMSEGAEGRTMSRFTIVMGLVGLLAMPLAGLLYVGMILGARMGLGAPDVSLAAMVGWPLFATVVGCFSAMPGVLRAARATQE